MKKSADLNETTPTQEKVAERARALWEGYGRPAGRDKEIWLEAERQLLGVDPLVEGSGGISVAAVQFDETILQKKPGTRLKKPEPKPEPKRVRPPVVTQTRLAPPPVSVPVPDRKKSAKTLVKKTTVPTSKKLYSEKPPAKKR